MSYGLREKWKKFKKESKSHVRTAKAGMIKL
jgi:hypothetical protein